MAVYMIQNEVTGLIKIGHATNPVERMTQIQIGSSDPLRFIRLLDGGRKAEKVLHDKFDRYWKRGEWFEIPAEYLSDDFGMKDIPLPPYTANNKPGRPMIGKAPLTPAERQARRRKVLSTLLVEAGELLREFPEGTKQRACGEAIKYALRQSQ